jgi:para-nitrobenzyl esterase
MRRLAALLASAGGLAGCAGNGGGTGTPFLPLVVRTTGGMVDGQIGTAAREFFGIPYAAPPVGALRWAPPRPAAPWKGLRDATQPGSNCAQSGSPASGVISTSTAEDCLFLNVYTPDRASHPLPVMVWIHGGGFFGGAGSIYDAQRLAAKGHVMVVTINYRLNAFGFLALPSLAAGGVSTGDYGLMDQQAALRWVRANAKAFGGDPHNVTIFGESAGGASVCAQMTSPPAFGLFQRAIAESGCIFPALSRAAAYRQGAALAAKLGCANSATAAACLRAKPVAAILAAESGMQFWPVVGGPTLPAQPVAAFKAGHYAHVPLLNGTNRDEGRFFIAFRYDALGHPLTGPGYKALIRATYGSHARAVLARYPLAGYSSPDLADAAVFTDSSFSCPALYVDYLAAGSGVYGYEFSDPSPHNDYHLHFTFPIGPAHSTELQYVFGTIPVLDTTPPFTPAQRTLSDQMIGYWSSFAATGTPGQGMTLPRWPAFAQAPARLLNLAPGATGPLQATAFATYHKCSLWASVLLPRATRHR